MTPRVRREVARRAALRRIGEYERMTGRDAVAAMQRDARKLPAGVSAWIACYLTGDDVPDLSLFTDPREVPTMTLADLPRYVRVLLEMMTAGELRALLRRLQGK